MILRLDQGQLRHLPRFRFRRPQRLRPAGNALRARRDAGDESAADFSLGTPSRDREDLNLIARGGSGADV